MRLEKYFLKKQNKMSVPVGCQFAGPWLKHAHNVQNEDHYTALISLSERTMRFVALNKRRGIVFDIVVANHFLGK